MSVAGGAVYIAGRAAQLQRVRTQVTAAALLDAASNTAVMIPSSAAMWLEVRKTTASGAAGSARARAPTAPGPPSPALTAPCPSVQDRGAAKRLARSVEQSGWQLSNILALLDPAALTRLELVWVEPVPVPAVAAVAAFSRLTALEIGTPDHRLPGSTAQVIEGLGQLQELKVCGRKLAAGLVGSIAGVATLTRLELATCQALPGDAKLACLTALSALHHLALTGGGQGGGTLKPPAPALFPNLRTFAYRGYMMQVCGQQQHTPGRCTAP